MTRRPVEESGCQHHRTREQGRDARTRPTPRLALDDREHQRTRRQHQHHRAREVGEPLAFRIARLAQDAGRNDCRDQPDRQVDQEDPTPAGLDEKSADWRSGPGGDSAGRGPDGHRDRTLAARKLGQEQRERRRHEHGPAGGLDHTRAYQPSRAGRSCAKGRGNDECDQPAHEKALATEQVGQAAGRNERVASLVPAKSRSMLGKAMLTMNRSMLATNVATETTTRTR